MRRAAGLLIALWNAVSLVMTLTAVSWLVSRWQQGGDHGIRMTRKPLVRSQSGGSSADTPWVVTCARTRNVFACTSVFSAVCCLHVYQTDESWTFPSRWSDQFFASYSRKVYICVSRIQKKRFNSVSRFQKKNSILWVVFKKFNSVSYFLWRKNFESWKKGPFLWIKNFRKKSSSIWVT